MADTQRRLILGNGEQYLQAVTKPTSGRSAEPPRGYDEARELVKTGVGQALTEFKALPATKKLADEAVFCIRLHPDATAKSYDPVAIFVEVPELRKVGSRYYHASAESVAQTKRVEKLREKDATEVTGRLVFVQGSPGGFERLLRHLDRPISRLDRQFREEVQRIERFDTLSEAEQVVGFAKDWKEGRVELVLHPSNDPPERQADFLSDLFDGLGLDVERTTVRQYPAGPTFVSCRLNRAHALRVTGYQPSSRPIR